MIVFPHCKINIGLFVTGKRSDGFHSLESVFAPVDWRDVLEINLNDSQDCTLRISGALIEGDPMTNIVVKAYQILRESYAISGVDFHLLKNLPTGAGLGGGSADGTYALKALSELFQLSINQEELLSMSALLGSDCPFFVENSIAFVSGRGEVMERMNLNLSSYFIMIAHPGIHVSTAEAYKMLSPSPASFDLRKLPELAIEEWKNHIRNDFEAPMVKAYPIIGEWIQKMYEGQALYAAMSGSGSSVFGIFSSKEKMMSASSSFNITSARLYTGKLL